MKIYVFGNVDDQSDSIAISTIKKIEPEFPTIDFEFIKPNQDLPFNDNENIVIVDAVEGPNKIKYFEDADLNKVILLKSSTAHDYDLGFQLKYLKKLGKLGKVSIVAIPKDKTLDQEDLVSIHSIFKKLVAQDIQGS